MQATTIYLPTETQNKLEKICQEKGKTVAEVIQEIVINQLENQPKKLPKSMGMGASGRGDLSSKVDELLWTEK
ncbi:hypothetical protein ACN4EE_00585 [Geminocystis sp. CENA526]|uniref:hypothetical protein n=1 Tax=Geminocystis sp. CENA526 TaxID=1355871 RepID=UPI003D6F0581